MTSRSPKTDPFVLLGLLVLAAAMRLPNLVTRGTWDADQGHDMLTLRALVRDGVIPLLGPPTSIGDVHHGALYYYLLAPAAVLTGGDSPLAVVSWIALAGIAAVGVTWWLARSIAGPVAGAVAGLAMAISPAAVDESTFIWNPNLIALSSALALAGAWRAWTTRRPAWWLVASVGTAITIQCHVLGVTLFPVIGALYVADLRRAAPNERRRLVRVGFAGLAVVALSFLPLVIHELTTNFSEVGAALTYLRAGGDRTAIDPITRFVLVASRVVSWPLVGLITTGLTAAVVAILAVIGLAAWRLVAATGEERGAIRWLTIGLLWTTVALTLISPSLSTIVEGLPNDHYHAFADPIVFVIVGVGAAGLWRIAGRTTADVAGVTTATGAIPARILTAIGLIALTAWAATHQPPAIAADGGFPGADAAAARIEASAPSGTFELRSLPVFKTPEAYAYPLVRDGRVVFDAGSGSSGVTPLAGRTLVVVCDSLFDAVIVAPCGGAAEATVASPAAYGQPVDRFKAAPRQTISIYRVAEAP